MARIRICVFGDLRVQRYPAPHTTDFEFLPIPVTPKPHLLLAYLACLDPGAVHDRSLVAQQLWPDITSPMSRQQKLHRAVSELRMFWKGLPRPIDLDREFMIKSRTKIGLRPDVVSELKEWKERASRLSTASDEENELSDLEQCFERGLLAGLDAEPDGNARYRWLNSAREELAVSLSDVFVRIGLDQDDDDRALSFFEKAHNLNPQNPDPLYEALCSLDALQKWRKAIDLFDLWSPSLQQIDGRTTDLIAKIRARCSELPEQTASLRDPLHESLSPISPYYVERSADRELISLLQGQARTIAIQGPRHSGKSSLLYRAAEWARENNYRFVRIDCDKSPRVCAERFWSFVAEEVANEMELTGEERPQEEALTFSSFQRFMTKQVLRTDRLPDVQMILLAFDQCERLLEMDAHGGYMDIFGNMRAMQTDMAWVEFGRAGYGRLRLLAAISALIKFLLPARDQSPFNHAPTIQPFDFTQAEVIDLNARYGAPLRGTKEIEAFHMLTGGHPRMVQIGLEAMHTKELSYARFLDACMKIYESYLRGLFTQVTSNAEMRQAIQKLSKKPALDYEIFYRLESNGILVGDRRAPRYRALLYQWYVERYLLP